MLLFNNLFFQYANIMIFFIKSQYQCVKKERKIELKIAIIIKINYAIEKDIFFNNFMHNFVLEIEVIFYPML